MACSAAALAAVCAQAGWLLRGWSPILATGLCLLPLAAGLTLILIRSLRRAIELDSITAEWIALGWVAASVAALGLLVSRLQPYWPAWAWPAVLIPLAALTAGLAAWLGRPSFVQAAIRVDRLGGFHDRVATAAELIEKKGHSAFSPAQECLLRQAAGTLRGAGGSRLSFWTRTRRMPAMLLLTMMLCGALLLPDLLNRRDDLGSQLAGLSEAQRRELAQRLHQQGASASAEKKAALTEVAKVVEFTSQADLEEALRKLDAQGHGGELRKLLAQEVRLLAQTGSPGGNGGGNRSSTAPDTQPHPPAFAQLRPEGPARVRVWDPDYARLLTTRPVGQGGTDPAPAGPLVPFDQAWQAARRKAEQALDAGEIPPEHRSLVRRFFDPPDGG